MEQLQASKQKTVLHIAQVIVSARQWQSYDYIIVDQSVSVGSRVSVSFGASVRTGVVVGLRDHSEVPASRLKPILRVIDSVPLLDSALMELLWWCHRYYHYPLGEVVLQVFPPLLRRGQLLPREENCWSIDQEPELPPKRAPKQQQLLKLLRDHPAGLVEAQIAARIARYRPLLRQLSEKGWIQCQPRPRRYLTHAARDCETVTPPRLNAHQAQAVEVIGGHMNHFRCTLLDGVTGSGKTEVYLRLVARALQAGKQCLVLVPEIGLTPQTVRRFQQRFPQPLAVLHSQLNEQERALGWMAAQNGEARIIMGTRSAVLVPAPELGLIILDEEHDPSYKQQEGFRYHARDVAVMRAKLLDIPVVLGTATPSLESYHNALIRRFSHVQLPQRAGGGRQPSMQVLDMRSQPLKEGVSEKLLALMSKTLQVHGQVMLFLNRRGYSPLLICHRCGWVSQCDACDAHMVYYAGSRRLRCHHCGCESVARPLCPVCTHEVNPLGFGTQRIEKVLRDAFPEAEVIRIDRDSTRRKGSLEAVMAHIRHGRSQILIGTQMLAKGHHLPNLEMVAVLDADQGLYCQDFRAGERLAQLLVQVSGRAGRGERPGKVYIQTHAPDHPLLLTLLQHGYHAFLEQTLEERELAQLPPKSFMALLRADAGKEKRLYGFLEQAKSRSPAAGNAAESSVQILGPVPAPMQRRAGRWRAQLLVQCNSRHVIQKYLSQWVEQIRLIPASHGIRWSLDVDPVDLY